MLNCILEKQVLNDAYETMKTKPKNSDEWKAAARAVYDITERRNERYKAKLELAGKVIGTVIPTAASMYLGFVCLGFEKDNIISSTVARKCIDMGLKMK